MITYRDLKIFDRDFCILSQLSTTDYGRVRHSTNGGTGDRINQLRAWELIESRSGPYGGYKLLRPLCDIPFSLWLNTLNQDSRSPTFRILSQFDTVSVETLLRFTPYWREGWMLPLDHAIGILSRLSVHHPTLPRALDYPALMPGYLAHAFTRLVSTGVVYPVARKGVVLTHPLEVFRLRDIMPVLSHVGKVYSGMLYHVADTKLVSLLSNTGEG